MTSDTLVGVWKLLSYERRTSEGQVSYPFGLAPIGYLMYTEDGHMSATVIKNNRALQENDSDEQTNVSHVFSKLWYTWKKRGSFPKYRSATHFNSFCGTYEIVGNTVIHHIEVSLRPDWTDTSQEHVFELDEDKLLLSTSSADTHQYLLWEHA